MEQVEDTFRSSFGGWFWGTAAGLGTLFLGLLGIVLTIAAAGDWGPWPLMLTGVAVIIAGIKWLEVMGSLYEITPERLILKRGIVMKSIDEIELYRIKDVRMDYSLLNQWAGIGTICLTSSDETTRTGELMLRDVPKAMQRREQLRTLVDSARRRRGVREMDMFRDPA